MKEETIDHLKWELLMVSKLAADKPMFFNPFNAAMAKSIRDRVLKDSAQPINPPNDKVE